VVYWGRKYESFFGVFMAHGAVLDLRPLHGKQIGDNGRLVEPVLLSEF